MRNIIVMTGGGSAGHVMPNLALLPLLQRHGCSVHYIGSKIGMEREIIEKAGLPYDAVHSGKFRRYFSLQNLIDPIKILSGYYESLKILKRLTPAVLFSKGGYVAVPVVFAARRLKIPVVLHESDYTPGLANRLCIPRAQRICVSFEDTLKFLPPGKGVFTGTPVRQNILRGDRQQGLKTLGFDGNRPVLLIMGGSLGAQALNLAADAILDRLLGLFDVAHIRGAGALNDTLSGRKGYCQFEFISDGLEHVFAATDCMLSRAGANAVFEILALKIPSLLVPLPLSASRGDQIHNARYFEKKAFARVLYQELITPDALYTALIDLYADRQRLVQAMQKESAKDAAGMIADEILRAAGVCNGTA